MCVWKSTIYIKDWKSTIYNWDPQNNKHTFKIQFTVSQNQKILKIQRPWRKERMDNGILWVAKNHRILKERDYLDHSGFSNVIMWQQTKHIRMQTLPKSPKSKSLQCAQKKSKKWIKFHYNTRQGKQPTPCAPLIRLRRCSACRHASPMAPDTMGMPPRKPEQGHIRTALKFLSTHNI